MPKPKWDGAEYPGINNFMKNDNLILSMMNNLLDETDINTTWLQIPS